MVLVDMYPEGKAAVVTILEALIQRHDLLEQRWMHRQRRYSREYPAVTCREQVSQP